MGTFQHEDAAMPYEPEHDVQAGSNEALNVKSRHEASLMSIDGVSGVGLGCDEIGDDAIIVYLSHPGPNPRVPESIEAIPVKQQYVGIVEAQ